MNARQRWCVLGLSLLVSVPALAQDRDARAVARCLRRYERSPASATRPLRGPAGDLGQLLGGPTREWSCMPASARSMPVVPVSVAGRVAACFERADRAEVVQGCVALAHALETSDSTAGDLVGPSGLVTLLRGQHASGGEEAVRAAVAAQGTALSACASTGTFVVHVRASASAGEAVVVERPADATDASTACIEAAAAAARRPLGDTQARNDELWSAVVVVRLGSS